ncbi:hypothetical protein FRC11_005301 [Ceratobasidium sp. 423]|nr:hypothetical protein FRC11_005301 [Ceratobasidium sp. 423]
MTNSPSTKVHHHHWGRTIAEYPRFYSKRVLLAQLEVPCDESKRAARRVIALETIKEICILSETTVEPYMYGDILNRITIMKLESTLELTGFLGECDNFALPNLVAGCIALLKSIKPSPFYYEYGYLCFKIMVIAVDTCLLRYVCDPTDALRLEDSTAPNNFLSTLWTLTALLISGELTGDPERFFQMSEIPPALWTAPRLDRSNLRALLELLHADQKYFTIALKEADSLGLCGLMYVLWKYVESEKANTDEKEYQESFLRPYTGILYRYCLVVPNFDCELNATRFICDAGPSQVKCAQFIDLEDSVNVMQAYSSYLKSQKHPALSEYLSLVTFVAPHVVPGCEDHMSDLFNASIQALWNSFTAPEIDSDLLATALATFLFETW